jgi:oxygen-independent coproporphyrinogen III oxidase
MAQRIIPIASSPAGGAAAVSPPSLNEQRLPRYTSYPPATEFRALDGALHSGWLGALPAGTPVSLYVHLPFCRQLCLFCGCFTKITSHDEPVKEYLELLLREIAQVRSGIGRRLPVGHIHFGGGSPTILEPADFTRLMDALRESFDILPGAEIAIEIDPRTVDSEKCAAYFYNGINRVSLGVQDFSPTVQQAVSRLQPYELVAGVVAQLRQAGIERINLDLMYGLPYQTLDSVAETARLALTLEPQRLAVFGYAHVPWMRKHQRVLDDMPLPGPEERSRMSEALRLLFVRNGFKAVGIDHYAREDDELSRALVAGTLRRNFQGYTTDTADTLLGFGLSAISDLPGGYAQNTSSIHEYRKALAAGESVIARGLPVSDEDRMRREIINELMCYYHVNLRRIADSHCPRESFEAEKAVLREMQERQLVTLDGDDLTITGEGRPFVRAVCAVFDQYLKASDCRYSLAV